MLSTILSLPLVSHYYSSLSEVNAQSNTNSLGNALSHFFGNITNTFNQLAKKPEYTVNLEGNQIFPNNTLKENIVDKYEPSTYNIKDFSEVARLPTKEEIIKSYKYARDLGLNFEKLSCENGLSSYL